ncbi:MAG: ADP-ribosylglycohydrolase family protein [Armatimonadetes bacterium]|nr:ADP-ribosylglycohydrolase family protein [Armatimonadota bacterium]
MPLCLILALLLLPFLAGAARASETRDFTRDRLADRVKGGWVGMLIGGLEGLAHEFKYNEQPRETLPDFEMLPGGAETDDDNDFEWTHLYYMDREKALRLPYERIVSIWKENMNTGLWVANKRARELMDEGILPPKTGDPALNRAAWYNLSGQFCVEAYGLIAPGMPQAAAGIGLHYAKIAVSGEPLQAAQYWTSLISLAAVEEASLPRIIVRALDAADAKSALSEAVRDALALHKSLPSDWQEARQRFDARWRIRKGWNGNSTPLNGGMVVLALLYGKGDFTRTLQYAMALGHDADCNAATAGAAAGARLGYRKIAALPGFRMADRFINRTRPGLPREAAVSEQAEMLMRVCEQAILENGGQKRTVRGTPGYRIALQPVKNLEKLPPDAKKPLDLAELLIGDITLPHEARPLGVPESYSWAVKPRAGHRAAPPEGWKAATMWGQVYEAEGGSPVSNVRIQIREPVLHCLSKKDGLWRELQRGPSVEGAAYRQDFAHDESVPADVRSEPDGSLSVKLAPGRNYHFWPSAGRVAIDPGDIAGMASAFKARLVADDPARPDDRGRARIVASSGGDYWRSSDAVWKADWSSNGDWAIGRFRFVTSEWQIFTACAADPETLRRNPPPLER